MKMKIWELMNWWTSNKTTAFLGNFDSVKMPSFLDFYFQNFNEYDIFLKRKYAEFVFQYWMKIDETITNDKYVEMVCNLFQTEFSTFCLVNKEYWEEYFKTTQYEYNPIQNYDQKETEQITNIDAVNGKTNYGQKVTTNKFGNLTVDNKGGTVPFDTLNQTETEYNHSDTVKQNDSTEQSASVDSYENTNNREMDRIFTRAGNIGTMTTQYMIEEERRIIINVLKMFLDNFFSFVCSQYFS